MSALFRRILPLAPVLAAFALMASPAIAEKCERPSDAAVWEKALLNWVNSERKALGLPAFRANGSLKRAALKQACDMALNSYFAHSRPGQPKLKERIKSAGYHMRVGFENLAYTRQPDPGTVAEIWRNSPDHWNAMTSPDYADAGVSIATGGGKIYWVMDMGRAK